MYIMYVSSNVVENFLLHEIDHVIQQVLPPTLVGKFESVDLIPAWDPYHYVLAIIMIISIIWYIVFTIPVFRTRSLI